MPEKQQPDMREFWRWYERSVNIGEGGYATPPPRTDVEGEPAGRPPGSLVAFIVLVGFIGLTFILCAVLH